MVNYYKYYFSSNKALYIQLAQKFGVRPYRVYQLAHGKKAKDIKERRILQELEKLKLIKRVGYW